MTDEEVLDIAAMVMRTTTSGSDIVGPLVQAGYRAGLEHAAKVCRDAAFSGENVSAATMNNTILSIVHKWKE